MQEKASPSVGLTLSKSATEVLKNAKYLGICKSVALYDKPWSLDHNSQAYTALAELVLGPVELRGFIFHDVDLLVAHQDILSFFRTGHLYQEAPDLASAGWVLLSNACERAVVHDLV